MKVMEILEYNDTTSFLVWQLVLQIAWVIAFLGMLALVTLIFIAPRLRTAFARAFTGRSLRSSLLLTAPTSLTLAARAPGRAAFPFLKRRKWRG